MKKFKLLTLILAGALSMAACSKGNEPQPVPVTAKKPLPEVAPISKPETPVIIVRQ